MSKACAAQDGVLSDSELNDFQVHCFAVPLQPEELAGVKAVVTQKLPEVRGMRSTNALLPSSASMSTWKSKCRRDEAHAMCPAWAGSTMQSSKVCRTCQCKYGLGKASQWAGYATSFIRYLAGGCLQG